jgi:CheY-like chemotaxis protein
MRAIVVAERQAERSEVGGVLERAAFVVEYAADAKGAQAAMARELPFVVVLAWPSKGGADLVRLVRSADVTGRAYLVILFDQAVAKGEISAALGAGANDFLRRPVLEEELVARARAPGRLVSWLRSARQFGFDFTAGVDIARLDAWNNMGSIVSEDLGRMLGQAIASVDEGQNEAPASLESMATYGAMIPLSLVTEQVELRVSIVVDVPTASWLASVLLGESNPSAETIDDILREMANTAGGAVKRAALPEDVTLTTGLPTTDNSIRWTGDGIRHWTARLEAARRRITIVGEIRRRENMRVPARELREGMVLVHDLRTESGALLVAAGTRLTSSTAQRVATLLGNRSMLEVACVA